MPRRNDPFSGAKLSEQVGLDQRLFQPSPPRTSSQRPDGTSSDAQEERPAVAKIEEPSDRPAVPRADRTKRLPKLGTGEGTAGKLAVPGRRAPRTEVVSRIVEHRPYDFYQDQVRWLNRKKVELEEEYGKLIPATAMVQLAVDLLIADYEANGPDSQLIRVLIEEERPLVRPFGPSIEATDVPSEEARGG